MYRRTIRASLRLRGSMRSKTVTNANTIVYAQLMMQFIAAGAMSGSIAHFHYKHQIWDAYDILVDSALALCGGVFWFVIIPKLDDYFQSEGQSIACIQSMQIFVALLTLFAELYDYSVMISITSSLWLVMDPLIAKIIPILANVTTRASQISILSGFMILAPFGLCVSSFTYFYFGSICGICLQTTLFACAALTSFFLLDEDIQVENETHHDVESQSSKLNWIFLWFCVFPAGATTSLIGYDIPSIRCQWSNNMWTLETCSLYIGIVAITTVCVCIICGILLHYYISAHGEERLVGIIWWTARFMILCAFTLIITQTVIKPIGNEILHQIFSGIQAGLFVGAPDTLLLLEASFDAGDFQMLCTEFKIMYILYGWMVPTIYHVGNLFQLEQAKSYIIAVYVGFSLLVIPYTYVTSRFACDPGYIYDVPLEIDSDADSAGTNIQFAS